MANDPTMASRRPRGGNAAQLEPPNLAFAPVQTRLLAELTASVTPQVKLITIVAPTGYGKSTCATALYRHYVGLGLNSLWVALDDRDTSTERVITLLEDALTDRESDSHPTQTLLRGDELLEDRVDALQDQLARQPEPTLVFIDNLGYCQDETLGYLLDRLVYKSPASVHFLLSSTARLPLNLSRVKLEGRVRELGYADLAMRPDEIRRFFGPELCAQIGDAGLEAIAHHTEGWPAALRLAQIILSTADRPQDALARFSGADEDIAELLNRQVLAGFPPEVRAFLLDIAPLRSFCADLCRHATGDVDTAKHLALLLRRNVFVIPLDRNRSWYRLHGLFREFLIEEAQRSVPAERRLQVLTRAAEWNERGGHWQDAIDHALAADSAPLACSVLDRVAAMFVRDRGDLRQYIEWIEALHRGGHQVGLEADFWYVFALVFHRRYETARLHNERLVRRIEQEPGALNAGLLALGDFRRRIEVIRVCIDTYTDRLGDALAVSSRWLAERGNDDPFDVATVSAAAGISLTSAHRFVDARQVMRTSQAAIAQTDSAYGIGWVSLLATMVGLAEGEYATVHTELYAALSRTRAALGDNAGITRTIAFVGARCAVEMGLDAEARTLLAQGLRGAHTHGVVDTTAEGLEAAVKLWSGRADDPISIPQLREIAASYPPRLGLMLSCLLVQRLLRLGRLDDALAEGATIGLGPTVFDPRSAALEGMEIARAADLYVGAQLELLIAAGQLRHAESLIAAETRLARAEGRHARLVELALAEMAVATCSHNPQPAARHFVRAVGIAARRRIVRPFRDRAETIAGLVNETKPQSWGFALDEERRFFVEICNGLPLTNSFLVEHFDQLQGDGALLETPTARELQLLALIEAGLSNQQLADRLSLSVATVKWHLYNLYTKLGVSSRSAALARARALNLLSR